MSLSLFEFAKSFVTGRLSAEIFSNAYIELWRIERDNGLLKEDSESLSACLSSIFCAADMYNPNEPRKEYELDAKMLKAEVFMHMKPVLMSMDESIVLEDNDFL